MANASPYWLLALGAVCSVERKEVWFNTLCSASFDAPGLRGGGRCRWRGGAGRFCTAQFALHPTHIVFPSLHGARCMRPQVEAQRCSPRDRRRRAPRKGIQRVLLCSCGRRPGCRPPPPRMIAVSPPPPPHPSNSHRPLRPLYTCAPFIYPCFPCVISVTSRASARSLRTTLGRSKNPKKSLRKALPTACQKQLIGDPEAYTYTLENCSA